MKKYLLVLAMFGMLFTACDRGDVLEENANCYIFYTSIDGKIVTPSKTNVFGANIVSNTYKKGKGIICFDTPITEIGEGAFDYCPNLTSVTIPDSVTEIGEDAFRWCSSLTAFYGKFASADNRCLIVDGVLNSFAPAGLTEYTIPNSVSEIGNGAFGECSSLICVTIPNSVTKIGSGAFGECSSLISVTIPNSVTKIGSGAFYYCSSLTSVTIPNSVTEIGSGAFGWCSSLISVTVPDSVTKIGRYTFRECSSLTSVIIPDSVTNILSEAFINCISLTSVTIPHSVTKIESFAFLGCDSLTSVYCKPTTPPSGTQMFDSYVSGRKIYVPTASIKAYKSSGWGAYASDIEGYDF